jgi:hypothetical protein
MNTSNFEEKFTAWIDGRLAGEELVVFERELTRRGFDPATERRAAGQLGDLLRTHSPARTLANADFFNRQILHRIEQEQPAATAAREDAASRSRWTLPRLAWSGAFCLLIATVLFQALIPRGGPAPMEKMAPYFAEVIDARPLDPDISADTIYTARDNVTVIWLDGFDYLPADYQLQ